ncbi:TetR family transcriptional regulator [Minwuia thermotolerans]|uniref:TetR family transcriptional regulator n=1 Tax=Minwuia thermotolerans TaxID=2056226 RepID=UPI000F633D60|nr:TetR family transcriptional regulator [Minwuia thermotolerans]
MRRTKEEALETRESILDAAERVFFERGVSRTTLDQIARAAGVTRGAVYWHFHNKSDLFNTVVERVRMPMESAFYQIVESADTLEDLERICATYLVEVHRNERLQRVYTVLLLKCEYTEDMGSLIDRERASKEHATKSLTRFFSRLQKSERMTTAREPRALALALYAYMLGLCIDYLRSPELYRMPDDAETLTRYFFAPLKPAPAVNRPAKVALTQFSCISAATTPRS